MLAKQIKNVILPTVSEMVHMKDGVTVLSDLIEKYEYNLFNKDTVHLNKLPDSNGNIISNSMAYGCSDYIKVEYGNSYACNQMGYVWEYDTNKTLKQKIWGSSPYVPSDGTEYIVMQLYTGDGYLTNDKIMFVKGSTVPAEYYPYNCYKINSNILKGGGGGGATTSPIEGITIDWIGDSMTNQGVFVKYVESNYNTISKKYCANGNTMQNDSMIVTNHLRNADKNADAIVIMGGTNDAYYSQTAPGSYSLGEIGDTTTDTFCGAIDDMCRYLLENFMGKRILICASPRRTDSYNGTPMNDILEQYVNAEKQIVESYGLPFLDLFHEYAHYTLTSDGLHPSTVGGNLIGRVIAKALENM